MCCRHPHFFFLQKMDTVARAAYKRSIKNIFTINQKLISNDAITNKYYIHVCVCFVIEKREHMCVRCCFDSPKFTADRVVLFGAL